MVALRSTMVTSFGVLAIWALTAFAMDVRDIPNQAPHDGIMASLSERQALQRWAAAAFGAARPQGQGSEAEIRVLRQDHNTLHYGQSCLETPLAIGSRSFERGLGTHANSEIVITLPEQAARFVASVGVDNNYDTQGTHGSVQFAVVVAGQEVLRTKTLRGGEEPVPVDVPLPPDLRELTLKVDTTEDGPAFDQADWADARLITTDGRVLWLDEHRPSLLLDTAAPPFSFNYDSAPVLPSIAGWKHTVTTSTSDRGTQYEATWEDPRTHLAVTADVLVFNEYPAVDWVLYLENRGSQATPIIDNLRAADLQLDTGNAKRPAVLHQLHGDSCNETTFMPFDVGVSAGQNLQMAPARGRPSQETAFPFWNFQYGDEGVITAIGWSGQWAAGYDRSPTGPTRFQAGMEKTHLRLQPGEKIRTPRILLMPWAGDRQDAHNRFRRLMLFQYVPRLAGRPLRLPLALQTFDRYISRPGWATEAGQLQAVEAAHRIGFDTYWFDAGWFVGGFPAGAGNWFIKPNEFPNGLKPISDRCRQHGLQFVLWFEPCRVAPDTQIAREYPQFILGDASRGGLFNLGDPKAREWITDLISQRITEFGVDVYREDFNIDPLGFWRNNDPPDRQGMTEIRFVEGHYLFWDTLRARHPGLWIDNCASGGRRIDLETCMRSVPLWRSDTSCSPGHPEWNQLQSAALSQYVPLHTASAWDINRYVFRSSGTGGLLCEADYLNPDFPLESARALLAEIRDNRKYWYGDFYPLTPVNNALDQFAVFQLHRSDLDSGIVLAFRRPACELMGIILDLRGLVPDHAYRFEFIDEDGQTTSQTATTHEVKTRGLELRIPVRGHSLLVRYESTTGS